MTSMPSSSGVLYGPWPGPQRSRRRATGASLYEAASIADAAMAYLARWLSRAPNGVPQALGAAIAVLIALILGLAGVRLKVGPVGIDFTALSLGPVVVFVSLSLLVALLTWRMRGRQRDD